MEGREETQPGVAVLGSISIDVTAFAPRLPGPGETVVGNRFSMAPGGKGANQAIAAARFGAPTWMVGCVGSDVFADLAVAGLSDQAVDTRLVRRVPGATGVAHIRVDAEGQNDIVIARLANGEVTEEDAQHAIGVLGSSVRVLMLQLEVPVAATVTAAQVAAQSGLQVILDPAPAATLPEEVWQHVDVVTPNESEATALTGVRVVDPTTARAAAAWFLDRGVRQVLITLGGRGAVRVAADACVSYEPPAVEVVDTTAAGDAFSGVLGAAMAVGMDIDQACRLGTAAGALAVTRIGASPAIPSRDEIIAAASR